MLAWGHLDFQVAPGDADVADVARAMIRGAFGGGHDEAERLARRGARLLELAAAAGTAGGADPTVVDAVSHRIWNPQAGQPPALGLFKDLVRLDKQRAVRDMDLMAAKVGQPGGPHEWQRVYLALIQMAAGDRSGLDEVFRRMTDPALTDAETNVYSHELVNPTQFRPALDGSVPDEKGAMASWYRSVRDRLVYEGTPEKGEFLLVGDNGQASRKACVESMIPFLGGTPEWLSTAYGGHVTLEEVRRLLRNGDTRLPSGGRADPPP